ncbi:MAG: hypothetical protein ACK4IX_09800 [Candidatus Sericytochromatia bacterium]
MSLNGLGSFNNNISNIEKQQPVNKASEAPKNNTTTDVSKIENTSVKDTANIKVQSSSKPVNVVSFDFDNKKVEKAKETAGMAALGAVALMCPPVGMAAIATMIYNKCNN